MRLEQGPAEDKAGGKEGRRTPGTEGSSMRLQSEHEEPEGRLEGWQGPSGSLLPAGGGCGLNLRAAAATQGVQEERSLLLP